MKKVFYLIIYYLLLNGAKAQSLSTIKEYDRMFKTYPYSDPDPIPKFELIYPYFRFDGYTDKAVNKNWKVVELENDYIKVMILPEIGGKIWTAIEKSTGKPFIYFNQVVKFRDIAMRGAWTSGGIEANYGIIGHTPNCSTPVDYWNEKKADGSVSCFIGTLDLLTQTYWTLEINLPKDKAFFTTRSFWHNSTGVEQPYYTWMNAGLKAAGNLQFIYPGNKYLGHNGEYGDWPINKSNGKDISYYENNNFGQYKSYHVFGQYNNFFGGYWHEEDFGMGRYATYADKPGKKIWIWGLSQQGMIWEKLLTDTNGQYVEVQSGRLFNQTAELSTYTPFKHRGFAPYGTDEWTEYWFPVIGTKGFVQANPYGSLNATIREGKLVIAFSPLQNFDEELKVTKGGLTVYSKDSSFKVLQPFVVAVNFSGDTDDVIVRIGDKVVYKFNQGQYDLNRPVDSPKNFDWNSAYGLWLQGKELIRSRNYQQAEGKLKESLTKNPNFLPALTDMALIMNLAGRHQQAFDYARHSLQVDTYDPAANYYYGLACLKLDKRVDAKDGFDIALQSAEFRGAAATELSKIYLMEKNYEEARELALNAINYNRDNTTAYQLLAITHRKLNDVNKASQVLEVINKQGPLNHFTRFENYLLNKSVENRNGFTSMIRNEMPWESYLQLGIEYFELGLFEECIDVLMLAPSNPELYYWLAYVKEKSGDKNFEKWIEQANNLSPEFVFPFRPASGKVLNWVIHRTDHWKPRYYLALINWHGNQKDKARKLFLDCDDVPDFAPFYAARAELIEERRLTDLKKATQIDPNQWRYGKLIINYFLETGNTNEAVAWGQLYSKKHPANYMISMLYAKALLYDGQMESASKILSSTKILPYEGATESRSLYRESWLMQSVVSIKNKKYKQALTMIKKARQWPDNLGVGKPYDADIDDRVENYLESLCYIELKNVIAAETKWKEIIDFKAQDGFGQFVVAVVLKKMGKSDMGSVLLGDWSKNEPNERLVKWSREAFDGKVDTDFDYDHPDFRIIKAVLSPN
ncbi:MAG TPA: DUF5107 domain-containing protein [Cytophagales bacterium]|nr:DUF5107 domain-containing protein [Cytophagales bacterium]